MFGLFKKKSEYEKLEEKYKALLKEAFELSTMNRSQSDLKQAEAEEVWKQMELMKKTES
jgi:TRAP-type mannitol/chloroaromatic compound transport system substrate-binding protein